MCSYGKFGQLLGVVSIGNVYCKFLVYAAKNAEVLTFQELKIKQITKNIGWLEFDPIDIWKCVTECIETCSRNLRILDIDPSDIIAIGISNQRATTILWSQTTGLPLHNAIAWSDVRTSTILESILKNIKGKQNYLKSVCGLPLSTCFSALKIKWLIENVEAIRKSIEEKDCLFGTLESWIVWNLTGGLDGGIHITDVTNAAYTMLMNLRTTNWDKKLCDFFRIPNWILPKIKSCSEIYGYIHSGSLSGIPISCCMGDQPAALLGQLCLKPGQGTCTIDDSCFLLFNTGQEIIDSDNGLVSTVAFKLGQKENPYYALEGVIANAGSSVNWLKDKLQISTDINKNDSSGEVLNIFLDDNSLILSSSSLYSNTETITGDNNKRSEIIFIPAFNGIYSPYWKHDARGLILGLTSQTTTENITQAAYESTGFQIVDILKAFKKDTPNWEPIKKLIVGGDFSENKHFMQFIADVVGLILERPQTTSPSCLGVMLAAGLPLNVLSLKNAHVMYSPPYDTFCPGTTPNRREILYQRWNYAVKKCIKWTNFENYDEDMEIFSQRDKDLNLPIRRSLPGCLFLTTSFALLLFSKFLRSQNIN